MPLNLNNSILKIYNARWSYINNFYIQITLGSKLKSQAGLSSNEANLIESEELNLYLKCIDSPQLSYSPIEEFIGNDYHIATGRPEAIRLTCTFRDVNQCQLYRSFVKLFQAETLLYNDQIGISITLFKAPDYVSEGSADDTGVPIMKYQNLLIDSVSQMQFSNETEAQVAEFSVQFRGAKPVVGI